MLQPLFYFPSTIIAIDDHQEILTIINKLFEKIYIVNTYQDPSKAMEALKEYHSPLSKIDFLRPVSDIDNEKIDQPEYCQTDINILEISQLSVLAERSTEISTLIIDGSMPNINGLDLCRKLKGFPMKKIMLTGKSSYQDAVSAFNEGIINAFIRKDSPTVIDELQKSVKNLTIQYFYDRSHSLLANLETHNKLPLSDEKFCQFFKNWRDENDIKEYYLIDKNGSFLCKNTAGEKFVFIIQTDDTINEFLNFNEEEVNHIFPDLIKSIKDRTLVPFFGIGKTHCDEEVNDWKNHFYPATIFEGKKRYYWAVIK